MEFNGKMYFGWPQPAWVGIVYEVDPAAVGLGSIVQLPDETELQLVVDEHDMLQVTETSSRNRGGATIFQATQVFDTNADEHKFTGDWDDLLWKLNAAAAVNALFHIKLTQTEYDRLTWYDQREWAALKARMSQRAASLVHLHYDFYDQGYPAIELLRTGRCP